MSHKLSIRPHHILCINNFIGKGYSDDFVNNMTSITNNLKDDSIISFKKDCDTVCSHCPERRQNICKDEEHIQMLDNNTICKLNIDINKEYLWKELKDRYTQFVKQNDCLDKICFECKWNDICNENIKAMQ